MNTIDVSQLMRKSMVRGDIWGQKALPPSRSLRVSAMMPAANCGRDSEATRVLVVLTTPWRPHSSTRSMSCCSPPGAWRSGMNSISPRPWRPSTSTSASSSAASASRLGTGRLCASASKNDVEKPNAPAATDSSSSAAICARSSSVAARSHASAPITKSRMHRVTEQRRRVHAHAARVQRVAVLGVALPGPWDAERERLARHVLDVAEELRHLVDQVGAHRHEPERAVADEHGRDAVLGHRVATRVPEQRRVEVGVHVDEAGRHVRAAGVEHRARRWSSTDGPTSAMRPSATSTSATRPGPGAVEHGAATEHDSTHRTPSSSDP